MPLRIYLYIFVLSMILSIFFISIFKKLSLKFSRLLSKNIPMVGGISVGLAFVITLLMGFSLYGNLDKRIQGIIIASLFMILAGIYDDIKELSIFNKFLVQIIATSILVGFGIKTQIIHIGDTLNLLITFFWIIGITNAFNHLDIMDGLCGGVSFLVAFSFLIISILNIDPKVSIISLALLGGLSGFLVYNLPPAKIYLGNCGSHLLGFILAAEAIIISYAPQERMVALLSPIVILGFPIYDTAFLIITRLKNKRSIFKKSKDHLAIRFLNQGYNVKRIITYLYFLTFLFCIIGILISQVSNTLGISLVALIILILFILTLRFFKLSNA